MTYTLWLHPDRMWMVTSAVQEATGAIKAILGKYYVRDTRNIWKALWEGKGSCSALLAHGLQTLYAFHSP